MPALPTVLPSVAEWRNTPPAPPRAPNDNLFMYLPTISSDADVADVRAVLQANQFPADPAKCKRALIVVDDAIGTGLGYTTRLIMVALLVAVKERRVLMAAPHRFNRWCAREPYTLNCIYQPWTHCQLPANYSSSAVKWNHRWAACPIHASAHGSHKCYCFRNCQTNCP